MPASCAPDSTNGSPVQPSPALLHRSGNRTWWFLLMLYPVVFLFGHYVQTPLLMGRIGLPFWAALFIGNIAGVVLLN